MADVIAGDGPSRRRLPGSCQPTDGVVLIGGSPEPPAAAALLEEGMVIAGLQLLAITNPLVERRMLRRWDRLQCAGNALPVDSRRGAKYALEHRCRNSSAIAPDIIADHR